jgi:hypothetical protein
MQLREELQAWHEQANGQASEEQTFTRTQAQRLAQLIEAIEIDGVRPFQGQVKAVEAHLYQFLLLRVLTPYSESGERIAVLALDRKPEQQGGDLEEGDVETIIRQAEQSSEGDEQCFAEQVKSQLLALSLKDLEVFEAYFACWNERSYSPVVRGIVREIKEGLPHL